MSVIVKSPTFYYGGKSSIYIVEAAQLFNLSLETLCYK